MEEKKPARKPAAKKSSTKATAATKPVAARASAGAHKSAPLAPVTIMPRDSEKSDTASSTSSHDGRRTGFVIGGTLVGLVVVFVAVFGVLIYKYNSDSRIVQIVSGIIPYPAEEVGGHFVSYSDYLFESNSIKHYYLSQTNSNGQPAIDFTTASGKQKLSQLNEQVLGQLQQDSIVQQLAHHYKVSVSNAQVQAQVAQITKSAGGTDKVKAVLTKYYGWSLSDLSKKIRFQLLQQDVSDKVQNDPAIDAQAKAKAESVYKQVQAGGNFATLAKKYSQDSSAANGGDLGFFGHGQVVKAFEDVAFAQQPGQVSAPVKTQYGYSIIETIEFNADHTQVHAAQILIKTIDFTTYLQQQQKATTIHQYIHP